MEEWTRYIDQSKEREKKKKKRIEKKREGKVKYSKM